MNSINMQRLRKSLCGHDKIPKDFEGVFPATMLWDWRGNPSFVVDVFVTKQLKVLGPGWNGRFRKPSGHRIKCKCPSCGKIVPVGRLAQHYKVHEHAS